MLRTSGPIDFQSNGWIDGVALPAIDKPELSMIPLLIRPPQQTLAEASRLAYAPIGRHPTGLKNTHYPFAVESFSSMKSRGAPAL